MSKTQEKGQHSEQLAKNLLEASGLTCIAENFRCRRGEIDLIFLTNDTLVFVEVRLRENKHYASAAESITYRKQQRILRTALYFLHTHHQYQDCNLRFDVVLFHTLNQHPEWIQSAFDASTAYY
ncbi:MAG: YraN family protein [Thiotrichales bacterium]|jgi:putative endonuclease|nr:YraN family protein [Thiotrichales bacterium]